MCIFQQRIGIKNFHRCMRLLTRNTRFQNLTPNSHIPESLDARHFHINPHRSDIGVSVIFSLHEMEHHLLAFLLFLVVAQALEHPLEEKIWVGAILINHQVNETIGSMDIGLHMTNGTGVIDTSFIAGIECVRFGSLQGEGCQEQTHQHRPTKDEAETVGGSGYRRVKRFVRQSLWIKNGPKVHYTIFPVSSGNSRCADCERKRH